MLAPPLPPHKTERADQLEQNIPADLCGKHSKAVQTNISGEIISMADILTESPNPNKENIRPEPPEDCSVTIHAMSTPALPQCDNTRTPMTPYNAEDSGYGTPGYPLRPRNLESSLEADESMTQ